MATPSRLYVSIQYPQSIGALDESKLDTFLRSIQQVELLYDYECSLNTLTFPSGESIPMGAPSLYSKTAPPYATTKTTQLDSLILVELVFVIATSASQADAIVTAVDDLIHKHLIPEKSNVKTKILVTSLNSGLTQKVFSTYAGAGLPLPYHQLHVSRMNYSVIVLLAILCLGILLLNFALNFHFQ